MGVLMESSQVNIHARAEPNRKPVDYYIVDKCSDLMMPGQIGEGSPNSSEAGFRAPAPYDMTVRSSEVEKTNGFYSERTPQLAAYHRERLMHFSSGNPREQPYKGDSGSRKSNRPRSPISKTPPKKKWMKNYMEEEPTCMLQAAVPPRNGIRIGPPPPSAPIAVPTPAGHPGHPSPILSALPSMSMDSGSELPRARSNSNGSSGPRAGTREVHNKLEKNRRAHLKECFEALRQQLPTSTDDKKSSNLSILDTAIKYIQALKRREKEFDHEMERLAREKISNQQKLSALKRDLPGPQLKLLPTNHDRESMEVDEVIPSRISPLLINTSPNSSHKSHSYSMDTSCTSSMSPLSRLSPTVQSPTNITLDLTTRSSRLIHSTSPQVINFQASNGSSIYSHIGAAPHSNSGMQRTQSAQIIGPFPHIPNGVVASQKSLNLAVNPASIQSVRGLKVNMASSLPTLTVTTVNPGSVMTVHQNQTMKQGKIHSHAQPISTLMTSGVNGQTTLVHPAQLQIQPLTQVMNGSSLVVSPGIQLFSTTQQGLRVLQTQGGAIAPIDLPNTAANSPIQRIRDVQKMGEASIGVGIANGVVRTSSEQLRSNHIAIKPQHVASISSSLRTNPQGIAMMNGITPLVVSQGGTHLMAASSHIGKVMGGSLMKTGSLPLAVNTQYLSATTIVKPVVVVSTSNGVPPSS